MDNGKLPRGWYGRGARPSGVAGVGGVLAAIAVFAREQAEVALYEGELVDVIHPGSDE